MREYRGRMAGSARQATAIIARRASVRRLSYSAPVQTKSFSNPLGVTPSTSRPSRNLHSLAVMSLTVRNTSW